MTTVKELEKKVRSLEEHIAGLEEYIEKMPRPRDRGPDSTRAMTDEDAERVCYGDLKDVSHREAAEKLGLSYGQIYSARGEYTFKHIHNKHVREERELAKA